MKAIVKVGLWKAIAFLVAVLFFSCTACSPNEPVMLSKPVVTIQPVESVTTTTAIIVASVVANEDNTVVSAMYSLAASDNWTTITADIKYSGTEAKKVTLPVSSLQPSTKYDYKVVAANTAGLVTSTIGSFTTVGLTKATAVIKPVINLKINSVTLVGMITANQDASAVAFEFKPSASTDWQSQSLTTAFSGKDSTQVSLDLASLSANTNYDYRVKVSNKAGQVVSNVGSFKTYAVTDYDGNYYHTVTYSETYTRYDVYEKKYFTTSINQTWLQENLKTTHYANGDPIPNVTSAANWGALTTGAYCYYNNNSKNGEVYGALYNYYVGTDPRGLIVGWHTPDHEWVDLDTYLGGYYTAGPALMEVGTSHWSSSSRPGNNSTGFTALPNGGFCFDPDLGSYQFVSMNRAASFWSTTNAGNSANITLIYYADCYLNIDITYLKNSGLGLRLIKN